MVRAHTLPALGGERREISVLFTDVAGFTTFSEARDPVELADITNQYLEGVCAAIFAHEGLVNAFMGDGVLAFFGAPQEQPDHADRAVAAAALAIDRFAEDFRAGQQRRGVAFGHTRIGVHTGFAFVSNIGTRQRLQYTALGDMLNTGSRLEGLNKVIGSRVCVSRDVAAKCRRHRFRRVGDFIVKGRTAATPVMCPSTRSATGRTGWRAMRRRSGRSMSSVPRRQIISRNCTGKSPAIPALRSTMPGSPKARSVR
jgi:adenylate cyclase